MDCDKNHIGQLYDWLYRCGLRQKQIWDQSNEVRSVTKTTQDNDMVDRTDLVHTETKTKLLGPIWPNVVYEEN